MYIDLMERAWKDDSNPTKYSKSQKKTKKQGNRNKATVCHSTHYLSLLFVSTLNSSLDFQNDKRAPVKQMFRYW